jgi:hypothetical protein
MKLLLENIHQLHRVAANGELRKAGTSMADSAMLPNAFVYAENGIIKALGPMEALSPEWSEAADETIDCEDRLVLPGFVDSHTHLVYARSREGEYVDRIKGLSYEEIAARGGGILNSARRLREMSEEELLESAGLGDFELGHHDGRDQKWLWIDRSRRDQDAAGCKGVGAVVPDSDQAHLFGGACCAARIQRAPKRLRGFGGE